MSSIFNQAETLDPHKDYSNDELSLPESLPCIKGSWYLLVYPLAPKKSTKSGIILTDQTHDDMASMTTVGLVVSKGELAYKHLKFQDQTTKEIFHWAEQGDVVVFKRHISQVEQLEVGGKKFFIIPDSAVMCTVKHPKEINPMYSYTDQEIEDFKKTIKGL